MPTAVISGTTNIQDTQIHRGGDLNVNFGGQTYCQATQRDHASARRAILNRVVGSSLPEGVYSECRFYCYTVTNVNTRQMEIHRITDANVWGEGTSIGAPAAGECDGQYTQSNTVEWAGYSTLSCCAVSGTDFDADASPPQLTFAGVADQLINVILPNAWFQDWQSGARVDNGWVGTEETSSTLPIYSTENADKNPYYEIDYEEATSSSFFYLGGF